MNKLRAALLSIFLSSCVVAQTSGFKIPDDDNQRVFTINRVLTIKDLYEAYTSEDVEKRRYADVFVFGILDATEGIDWCGYSVISPDGMQEHIYETVKKSVTLTPDEPAAKIIRSSLANYFPCKDVK